MTLSKTRMYIHPWSKITPSPEDHNGRKSLQTENLKLELRYLKIIIFFSILGGYQYLSLFFAREFEKGTFSVSLSTKQKGAIVT